MPWAALAKYWYLAVFIGLGVWIGFLKIHVAEDKTKIAQQEVTISKLVDANQQMKQALDEQNAQVEKFKSDAAQRSKEAQPMLKQGEASAIIYEADAKKIDAKTMVKDSCAEALNLFTEYAKGNHQ